MEEFVSKLIDLGTTAGGKLIYAVLVLVVGCLAVKAIKKGLSKTDKFTKLDKTAQGFIKSLVTVALYAVLIVTVIGILGIPMASITAVIASCGLAIGLALQGALSNFAGGIMVMVFKPFKVGDYVASAGAEGIVKEISVFYTTILTIDNKRITVPNGSLMNANVTNFSSEELRRVDLDFKVSNACDQNVAKGILLKAAEGTKGVLGDPEPFARMTGVAKDTYVFTVRAWCKSAEYWDVYFDLIENCSGALGSAGIKDPEERLAVRMTEK